MGGGGSRPKITVPVEPDPAPTPIPGREISEAKKKVRKRAGRGGRQQNILAGRLMSQRGDVLNTQLG